MQMCTHLVGANAADESGGKKLGLLVFKSFQELG